jgi:HAMP domain-containing protein
MISISNLYVQGLLRQVVSENSPQAALWQAGSAQALISLLALLVVVGLLYVVLRLFAIRPLVAMTSAMARLAGGDLTVAIPATERGDEIGEMAKAVEVFKNSMTEAEQLRAEQRCRSLSHDLPASQVSNDDGHLSADRFVRFGVRYSR